MEIKDAEKVTCYIIKEKTYDRMISLMDKIIEQMCDGDMKRILVWAKAHEPKEENGMVKLKEDFAKEFKCSFKQASLCLAILGMVGDILAHECEGVAVSLRDEPIPQNLPKEMIN